MRTNGGRVGFMVRINLLISICSIINYYYIVDVNLGERVEWYKFQYQNSADHDDEDAWWLGNNAMSLIINNMSHPHLGVIHPNGSLGMIVDPSPRRLRQFDPKQNNSDTPQYNILCPLATRVNRSDDDYDVDNLVSLAGIEGEGGNKVLQKIKRGMIKSREFLELQKQAIDELRATEDTDDIRASEHATNLTSTVPIVGNNTSTNMNTYINSTARAKRSKILCLVYTAHSPPPEYNNANVRAQAQTWGRQCDGFIAASNFTDHDTGSVHLSHLGPETYGNMWQKVRSMWAYAHDNYRDEFDFFHIGGDDVYVMVDNLRAYLDGPEVTALENGQCEHFYSSDQCTWTPDQGPRPLYFASPTFWKEIYPSGGPGYTLNRAALEILNHEMSRTLQKNIDPREDVFIGQVLSWGGVRLSKTYDSSGGHRYGESAQFMFDFDGVHHPARPTLVADMFGLPPPRRSINSVSEQFITSHLKMDKEWLMEHNHTTAELIYRYHAILNDWCD